MHRMSRVVAVVLVCAVVSAAPLHGETSGSIIVWGYAGNGLHNVPVPNSGFVAIAAGGAFALGLRADGSIAAWGDNTYGQCVVPAPNTGFTAIAAGDAHALAVKADGSIVAWGDNTFGQCTVPAPNAGFVAVAAGSSHCLGLKADGSIVAWGFELFGACDVPTPNTGFAAIAAGADDSLAIKTDGSVLAWGVNAWLLGWLGLWPPADIRCTSVALGGDHGLGLATDGSVVAWGSNWWGQCDVPTPNADFAAVAAGDVHSLGLKADGSIVAWGGSWPGYGECDVPAPNTGFVAVAAGGDFSMGLKGGTLPRIISASWSVASCYDGGSVRMTAQTEGVDRQMATFEVLEKDSHEGSSDEFVTTIEAGPVTDGLVTAYWTADWQQDGPLGIFDPPEFYFIVKIAGVSAESGLLTVGQEKEAVIRPMIGLPTIQKRAEAFEIEITSAVTSLTLDDVTAAVSLDLSSSGGEQALAPQSLRYDQNRQRWILTAALPGNLAPALYDLKVTIEGRELVRPNAVSVVSNFSDDPLICFITDIHADFSDMGLIDPDCGTDGTYWRERTQHFAQYLSDAYEAHADFILIGGDNVDWSTDVNRQWFYEALQQSQVPTFVQVGNHDYRDSTADVLIDTPEFDDSILEFFWDNICSQEHYMHYSFNYGDKVHVIGLNSGPDLVTWPEPTSNILDFDFVKSKGLTDEQMIWLSGDLSDSRANVVFMHHPVFAGEEAPYDDSTIYNYDKFREFCRDSRMEGRDIVAVFSGHKHCNQPWLVHGTLYINVDQACRAPLSLLTRPLQDLYVPGGVNAANAGLSNELVDLGLYFAVPPEP